MTKKRACVVGVTGSIGAGKTSFARALAAAVECPRRAVLIDADEVARAAIPSAIDQLKKRFGGDIVRADGSLDRALVAERAFADDESAKALNAMIHPFVIRHVENEIERAGDGAVIIDVPLLYESGMDAMCDKVVVVVADDALRRERSRKFGNPSRREKFQWSQDDKSARADFIVENNGSTEGLSRKAAEIAEKIFPSEAAI